eukprot:6554323-Prymnesium_polylepis.1
MTSKPWGRVGFPMGPRGKGGSPHGHGAPWEGGVFPWAGSCICGVRLYSFAVERVIWTTNHEEATTKEEGLRNEHARG